ncbi:murein L,D-transpeptidase catalytic domain family protein [Alphaproteobacteria bacterium KMM 3653]|uniref:Murein L,D-transpeptidase catalytic domain family protein n=1 Tax=Harenicola maris TaxID=2841044 RepID=A0AAP2CSK3_9RHOB|nr:murein L,D-transpeptidase catalytic domain family protein [Harenicola maris]
MARWAGVFGIALVMGLTAFGGRAATLSADVPAWLRAHVGTGEGQIAPVVLERARDLYKQQMRKSRVRNPCYMAMDATRPSTSRSGAPAKRFYTICEGRQTFTAVSSGYGSGRNLPQANFRNGRECARHFSNALDSNLTAGGSYLTAEARTSHKGYFTRSGKRVAFNRTFLVFDGMGETSNARERAIGGHQATFLRTQCRFNAPESPYADDSGFARLGRLVDYTSGRSNGCTTWSEDVSKRIISLVERQRTTLYIYPESRDINAVAKAAGNPASLAQKGLYWNAACLSQIGAPKFWRKQSLEPVIRRWRRSLPQQAAGELPICR